MNSIRIFCYIMFCLLLGTVKTKNSKCDQKALSEADNCMFKMILFGDRKQTFREQIEPMKTYCRKEIIALDKCLKDYSRTCLPSISRQVTNILLFGVKRSNAKYCNSQSGIERFVSIAKCNNHRLEDKHRCMDRFVHVLNLVRSLNDKHLDNNRIPILCCYFSQFQECLRKTFPATGETSERCTNESIRSEALNLVTVYAEDVLGMVCGDFGQFSSQKCQQFIDIIVTKNTTIVGTKFNAKSLLPYLIDSFHN